MEERLSFFSRERNGSEAFGGFDSMVSADDGDDASVALLLVLE